MTERPILFQGAMVRALLAGTKRQTRRVVPSMTTLGSPEYPGKRDRKGYSHVNFLDTPEGIEATVLECKYGKVGDRLWVRENGWERPERTPRMMREGADTWEPYYFDADGLSEQEVADFKTWGFKRRPSIHMPRWASRITLEITGVRVERLQDISEADASAEGVFTWRETWNQKAAATAFLHGTQARIKTNDGGIAQRLYHLLWESINGPGSWEANPWVWVVEFKRVQP